ncbi:MAG: cell surface protein SprA, partial [Alloprevotella sp.]|nr:cell surface protein SprA [Alloprevotella sp.]
SGVTINRIELWVTNKSAATTNTRNLIALTDLGEAKKFNKKVWIATPNDVAPSNRSNNAYNFITQTAPKVRDITQSNAQLDAMDLVGGEDYEKLESARLLSSSEYSLNSALGYVSLKSTLQPDQVLAVAFEYTYRGQTYQVGEFSTDVKDNTQALLVKSLKNTANTPKMGNWKLMMRNVYALGATAVQRERFSLDIKYLSDTTGVDISYLPIPRLKDKRLLSLLGLDNLDNNARRVPNGYFDFVEGYTIDAASGRIFFPQVEPFGSFLANVIGDADVARNFAYTELYDSTRTIAKQVAEHNKFVIKGRYKATKSDEIVLNTSGIPQGSVVVTAGGQILTEGSDYTVDYSAGVVRILNKSILDAGTPIQCSVESNTDYGLQRKTMMGLNWQYDFSRDFQFGGSLLHLSEQPLT